VSQRHCFRVRNVTVLSGRIAVVTVSVVTVFGDQKPIMVAFAASASVPGNLDLPLVP
jgi:hypothetical protein